MQEYLLEKGFVHHLLFQTGRTNAKKIEEARTFWLIS
jgi:hypothetical protein